mmetsp:Transcript_8529/g.14384  ORF Transcript_8529/g.14384 Transcript_8529/m.14384 type:complete len:85 (-) Transcript_8529:149-403(-)
MSHLQFEGETVWRVEDKVPQWLTRSGENRMSNGQIILPSDTDFRADIPPMLTKDWKEADRLKLQLEQRQRDDFKLREEAAARRK